MFFVQILQHKALKKEQSHYNNKVIKLTNKPYNTMTAMQKDINNITRTKYKYINTMFFTLLTCFYGTAF